jgi:two-component system, sensor histidine kinase and response regulator
VVGVFWVVDHDTNALRCVAIWRQAADRLNIFVASSRRMSFTAGVGLPGRVWARREPVWIPDVVRDANFPRAAVAAQAGLHAAFGFPIELEGEMLAILEFFSPEIQEPDHDLLSTMGTIGSQIGLFIKRWRAEETLRESEARTHSIIDTALDAVITMDVQGRITEWNTRAEKLFGWPRDEAVGRILSSTIIPPRYWEAHERGVKHYVETGDGPVLNRVVEIEARHREGYEFPVELAIVPLRLGGTMVFSAFLRDITERKQAEAALRRMNDVLEQRVAERTADLSAANVKLAKATRLKDEFLASMSHELRTPLNAILGLSEALREQVYGPLTDKQDQSLRRIAESGYHLLALITDILDLSKIEAGKVDLTLAPVDVAGVCQASLRLIRESAQKKHQHVTSDVDPAVSTLLADERRLKQMLVNLLSNAVKFTPDHGRIGLEVIGHLNEQLVVFTVWDTGIGIADADRGRLFQPFVQLDSSLARHHAGTGLGLSLVARLADLHGGRVTLESTVGQGSRFCIVLPWRVNT